MALLLDSEAQFDLRISECKVPDNIRDALKANGITTLASLSYSFGQPGQVIDQDAFAAWARSLEPRATLGGVANLRRLVFESQNQLLAILRDQVTSADTTTRKIPQAERESRMNLVRQRLTGVLVSGSMEPGHSLLDSVMHMVDKNQLKYLPPERCVSRVHELTSLKAPDRMLDIEANKIVVKDKDEKLEVPAHTSLQVLEAMKRRGIALDFGDCMGFVEHDTYVQALFAHLHREPPPGYQRCTVAQLVSADKEAWRKVIELNVKPKRDHTGARPLDHQLMAALTSYEVSFTLIPLPMKAKQDTKERGAGSERPGGGKGFDSKGAGKGKWQNRQKGSWSSPYQKGKGKSKWEPRIPAQIRDLGGTATTPAGKRICFDFSLGKCSIAADGAECPKGLHVCAKCYGPHALKDHNSA